MSGLYLCLKHETYEKKNLTRFFFNGKRNILVMFLFLLSCALVPETEESQAQSFIVSPGFTSLSFYLMTIRSCCMKESC